MSEKASKRRLVFKAFPGTRLDRDRLQSDVEALIAKARSKVPDSGEVTFALDQNAPGAPEWMGWLAFSSPFLVVTYKVILDGIRKKYFAQDPDEDSATAKVRGGRTTAALGKSHQAKGSKTAKKGRKK